MVFLSYSRKDAEFVRELHRRLTRDGVECFYDEASIEGGDNFVLRLQDGVGRCDRFVAVLSPDFVASDWAQREWTAAVARGVKIIPLMLRECGVPPLLQTLQMIDASDYPRLCGLLGGTEREDIAPPADRTTLPPVTRLPARSSMPHRSMEGGFVGRVAELWTVHDQLRDKKTSIVSGVGVVYGAGGLGKTQLAIEYAHRFNAHYPGGIFWIDADQGIQRLIDILVRCLSLKVDGKLPVPDQLASIWATIAQRLAMLVVLDNFPEQVAIREWLPTSGDVYVLVTTRRTDMKRYSGVRLPVLTVEEGQRLLGEFSENARALVEEVGGLPLALELLRAQLTELSSADVLNSVRTGGAIAMLERFADEYREDLPDGHARSIAATIQASWDQATEDGREVLRVLSHLASAPVPLRLLRAVLGWAEANPVDDRLRRAVSDLVRLSLVERDSQGQPMAHRLILGFAGALPDTERYAKETLDAVDREMRRTTDDQDTASYRDLEAVLPHADWLLARVTPVDSVSLWLANTLRWHHNKMGRFQVAKQYGERALAIAQELYPHSHPEVAIQRSNLALTVRDLGALSAARDLLRQTLAAAEHSYPAGHPNIAISQSNLATVLQELGELQEARDLLRKALAADEQTFPASHPTIAVDQSNLALLLKDLGELQEARDLLRKALASDDSTFPAGHPNIAIRQSNLASVLRDLGEFTEARDLAQKAYASTLTRFGPDHPKTRARKSILDSLSPPGPDRPATVS